MLLIGSFISIFSQEMFGQPSSEELYRHALGPQSHLSNGSSFKPSYVSRTEHPFFLNHQPDKGSITYDEVFYPNAMLLFNLASNEVLLKDSISGKTIRLINENISAFNLHNHTFLRINSISGIENGFYDILYKGESRVMVLRNKSLQYIKRDGRIKNVYQTRDRIFINIGQQFFNINSKSSVLEGFGNDALAVKSGMKGVDVKFSSDKERYCVEAAKLFDQIKRR